MGDPINNHRSYVSISLFVAIILVGNSGAHGGIRLGMTEQQQGLATIQRGTESNVRAQSLPTTYANRMHDKAIFAKWNSFVGRWVAREESGKEVITVALTPRLPRPGKDPPHGTLVGFIPEGKYEGVLFFENLADDNNGDEDTFIEGNLYRADTNLTRLEANLLFAAPHQKPGSGLRKKRLLLQIVENNTKKEYLLEWVSDIDDTALSGVCIIGHRGLSFAYLDNTPKALRHAWMFGASGIEFDVTVPYTSNGAHARFPLTNNLVVYHPPLLYQTTEIGRIPDAFLQAKNVFGELEQYWVPFVYVDPKVKWLSGDSLEDALKNIITLANDSLLRTNSLTITIAAPDDNTARFLSKIHASLSSSYSTPARLSWTLEWTEVERPGNIFDNSGKRPSSLSFNLIKIRGGSKWPLMEWLFRDLRKEDEKEIRKNPQTLIFWTANDGHHFNGSLNAATHLTRMGKPSEPGEIGIMTDYPHRLAYWLATRQETSSKTGFGGFEGAVKDMALTDGRSGPGHQPGHPLEEDEEVQSSRAVPLRPAKPI